MQNKELFNFDNIRVYQDENNVLHYNTKDVVRELGYERIHTDKRRSAPLKPIISIDGVDVCNCSYPQACPPMRGGADENLQYNEPRWDRVNNNLNRLGYPSLTEEQKNGYVPENLVYKLGFHASTEKAIHFQNLVSDKILPYFRQQVDQSQLDEMNKKVYESEERMRMQQDIIDKRTEQYHNSLIENRSLQDRLDITKDRLKQTRSLKYNEELNNDRLREENNELRRALEVIMNVASATIDESLL